MLPYTTSKGNKEQQIAICYNRKFQIYTQKEVVVAIYLAKI